jgi:hypothetical protein
MKEDSIWDYWVLELCPSSGILNDTKEHNISEIIEPVIEVSYL